MSDTAFAAVAAPCHDRKTGLIAFGLLQVAIGGLCALFVPLIWAGAALSRAAGAEGGPQLDTKALAPALLIYGAGAAWFIWMGVGSMLARRWARALTVAASWLWLVCGVSALIATWITLPDLFSQLSAQGQLPVPMVTMIKVFMLGFMAIIYVALPLTFALFYGGQNVKATCESRNPAPSWTDSCPLPVLGVSLLFGLSAISMPAVGCYGWALPFFGAIVSGPAGAAVALATAALTAYLAWGACRLDRRAWACSIAVVTAWAVSIGATFTRHSVFDYYASMNIPEEQVALMKPVWDAHSVHFAAMSALWFAALLGYLWYTRRFYPPAPTRTEN